MKSIFFLLLVSGFFSVCSQDPKIIFNAERIVFYGLDFTKAKLALPDARPDEIKKTWIPQWSDVVMTDNERFNKEAAFQKVSFYGDPTVTNKRNEAINASTLSGKTDIQISKETIGNVIAEYKGGMKTEGLGVVFIIESFDKKKEEAAAHVVFFDIASRKVLLAKRMTGIPRGGGLKNYWAGAIQRMFEKLTDKDFALWKTEVMGK